jgi:hypothetical protein
LVDDHFAGRLTPDRERRLRAHIPRCVDCQGRYRQQMVLDAIDPARSSAQMRLARGLGFGATRRRLNAALPALAIVGGLVLLAAHSMLPRIGHRGQGFAARGSARGPTPTLVIYRMAPGSAAAAAGDRVTVADELAFAYVNPSAFTRLLVFGLDEHGHVYWYHPAWTDSALDPSAIPISTEPGLHELPEAMRQTFAGQTLTVHALFTNQALTVKTIESLVHARGDQFAAALPATFHWHKTLAVAPEVKR